MSAAECRSRPSGLYERRLRAGLVLAAVGTTTSNCSHRRGRCQLGSRQRQRRRCGALSRRFVAWRLGQAFILQIPTPRAHRAGCTAVCTPAGRLDLRTALRHRNWWGNAPVRSLRTGLTISTPLWVALRGLVRLAADRLGELSLLRVKAMRAPNEAGAPAGCGWCAGSSCDRRANS